MMAEYALQAYSVFYGYDASGPVGHGVGRGGTVLRAYVHGTGADDPLIWYEAVPGGTSRRYLHADHQGSIVAVADQNGSPIAINSYDPWGVPGANNQGRFQFTGQAWLSELGMYYYKARIYWPTIGRFMQVDPIGYAGQINLYDYVGDDPENNRDPSGNGPEIVACAAAGPLRALRGRCAFLGELSWWNYITKPEAG